MGEELEKSAKTPRQGPEPLPLGLDIVPAPHKPEIEYNPAVRGEVLRRIRRGEIPSKPEPEDDPDMNRSTDKPRPLNS